MKLIFAHQCQCLCTSHDRALKRRMRELYSKGTPPANTPNKKLKKDSASNASDDDELAGLGDIEGPVDNDAIYLSLLQHGHGHVSHIVPGATECEHSQMRRMS